MKHKDSSYAVDWCNQPGLHRQTQLTKQPQEVFKERYAIIEKIR